MSAPAWNELKAHGAVVADLPARKLAIYANPFGQVVMLSVEDGRGHYIEVDSAELAHFAEVFAKAAQEALGISHKRDADYEAFLAIENAKGRAPGA